MHGIGVLSIHALCLSVAFLSPDDRALAASASWPMFRRNPSRTGHTMVNGPSQGFLVWSYRTGDLIISSPAVDDAGRICIGSSDHRIYNLSASGTLAWSYRTGDSISSSPALDADGRALIASRDGTLYAVSSSGDLVWSYALWQPGADEKLFLSSPLLTPAGGIRIGSATGIFALNAAGSLEWSYATGDYTVSSPSCGADGTVYAGGTDKILYAIGPRGALAWSYSGSGKIVSSAAVDLNGRVILGEHGGPIFDGGALFCFEASGTFAWSYAHTYGIDSSPALGTDGGLYYGGSLDNTIYRLESDGALRWSYITGEMLFSSPALDLCGSVYIGSSYSYVENGSSYVEIGQPPGAVNAIAPDGSLTWSYRTAGAVMSSPAIGSDGRVHAGSSDNTLYVFAGPPEYAFAVVSNAGLPAPAEPGDTISFIRCDTHGVIDTIPVGRRPQGVEITADRQRIYVANEDDRTVSIVHTGARAPIATVPVPLDPRGVKESADGRHVYVTCGAEGETGLLAVIGRESDSVEREIPVGERPSYGIVELPEERVLFVSNRNSNDISVIDTDEWTELGRIRGLDWPVGMARIGDELYIANYGEDATRRTPLSVLSWDSPPRSVASDNAWQILSCGGLGYATNYNDDRVTVLNPSSRRVVAFAGGMCGPNGIAASRDGRLLYVVNSASSEPACGGQGIVAVLDRENLAVVRRIAVGAYPSQIDVAGPARADDWPCGCPPPGAGATLCVAEPTASRGGTVALSYRLEPGLSDAPADALLGVVLPDGSIHAFSWNLFRLEVVPMPVDIRPLERVGRWLDMSTGGGGTLSFPVPLDAPQGEYRFIGALVRAATDDAEQVVYSNRFRIR